jgi:hypothetical protein
MPDSDIRMVKPVDSLPTVASVASVNEREQQKKKQRTLDSGKTRHQEQDSLDVDFEDSKPDDGEERHSIDYRA